ncbi:hypothetical protein [Sphingobium yanoikuyae]|jgi:hypothetical protein|uniref:hypothetical protein n=1 Tax=Sphingobium TaxID=165695 RepID=UPI0028AA73E8|nr:hypothetical protein [Sphingobium yanoikuyae]
MDTHDSLHILHGHGADWSTVDLSDYDLDDLTEDDLAELGLMPPRPRYVPRRAPSWQTTDAEAEHLDQPYFTSSFNKVRWFALRGLEDQASLTNDRAELDRIGIEREYWRSATEADYFIERRFNKFLPRQNLSDRNIL